MKQSKLLMKLFSVFLLLSVFLQPQLTNAAEGNSQIIFHNLSEKNDVTYHVFDVTEKYSTLTQNGHSDDTAKEKIFELGTLAANEAKPVTSFTTTYDALLQENGIARFTLENSKTYLILEHNTEDQTDKIVTMPIILTIPKEGLGQTYDLYGKPVTYSRNFSFKKISSDKSNGEQFLGKAAFILSKQINGKTFYLGEQALIGVQHWIESKAEAKSFVSNEQGEVAFNIGLTTGTYLVEEIKAPEGYQITEEATSIEVVIPNNYNKEVSIVVGKQAFVTNDARVENNPVKNLPNTQEDAGSYITQIKRYARRVLPKTGEARNHYILLGAAILAIAGLLMIYLKKGREKYEK